jgi:hypothetical protein
VPYLLALALTLLVEVPVYVVVFRFAGILPGARGWAAAVGVNLVTHPVAWLLLSAHPGWFWAVEGGVVLVEAGLLWAWVRRDPGLLALTALVANAASAGVGLIVTPVAAIMVPGS